MRATNTTDTDKNPTDDFTLTKIDTVRVSFLGGVFPPPCFPQMPTVDAVVVSTIMVIYSAVCRVLSKSPTGSPSRISFHFSTCLEERPCMCPECLCPRPPGKCRAETASLERLCWWRRQLQRRCVSADPGGPWSYYQVGKRNLRSL